MNPQIYLTIYVSYKPSLSYIEFYIEKDDWRYK